MSRSLFTAILGSLALAGCAVDPATESAADPAVDQATAASVLPRPPHCIPPWGIDWSETLGVLDADVVGPDCKTVVAGDRYVPEVLWITNTPTGTEGNPVRYPIDYVPVSGAPTTDFVHKLARVRYVVHPGEQETVYTAPGIEKSLIVADLFAGSDQFRPSEQVWPVTALLGRLPALPAGAYTADIHFVMTTEHCDGQGTDRSKSCLPAGDSLVITRAFTVAR